MRELRQKQIIKRRLYSTPFLVLLSLISIFLIHGAYVVAKKGLDSRAKVGALNEKKTTLIERQAELKDSIDSLQTDAGIEKEIKEKFSVSKIGEHVVVIVDPKPVATSTDENTIPWYKKLWSSIIGD